MATEEAAYTAVSAALVAKDNSHLVTHFCALARKNTKCPSYLPPLHRHTVKRVIHDKEGLVK